MSGPAPRQNGGEHPEDRYRALVALHALSPDFRLDRQRLPEACQRRDIGVDLRLVAEATTHEISVSARLAVLYDLAKAGYPGREENVEAYRALAVSAAQRRTVVDRPVDVDQLLADIVRAAGAGEPLAAVPRIAQAFVHRELAFIGGQICSIQRVEVGGIPATWIYSEFETDASFASVAEWLDPRRWPALSPMFVKRMDLIGPAEPMALTTPPAGTPHWQGIFHEEVQLVRRLSALLNCTYWQNGDVAATTFDMDNSLDREIDVQRGYLLVTNHNSLRKVQVLEIIGFTEDVWDRAAAFVGPFWTEWIRGAVRDATSTTLVVPSQTPGTEHTSLGEIAEDWIEYFGEAVQAYLDLGTEAATRMRSAPQASDALAEGTRWWSQFAKDWSRAWTNWSDAVTEVAKEGLDIGMTPSGTVVVRVTGLGANERPVCSELVCIDPAAARISPADVRVSVEEDVDGSHKVHLRAAGASSGHGLYVGRLRTGADRELGSVQLYISQATRT